MKKRYILFTILIFAILLTGCGKKKASSAEAIQSAQIKDNSEKMEEEESESLEEEPEVINWDEQDEEDDFEELIILNQKDSDKLMSEYLEDMDVDYEMSFRIDKEDESYYVYTISTKDDILDQYLAISCESGNIYVYDEEADKMLPFKEFEKYNPENDRSIEWTGVYGNGKYDLIIEETDPGNFEFSIFLKDSNNVVIGGFATMENHVKYSSEVKGDKFVFKLEDDVITLECSGGAKEYSGKYKMK